VLQVLGELGIEPDLVTGTSIGALIGGLYASGHNPSGLAEIATELDWISIFSDRLGPGLIVSEQGTDPAGTVLNVALEGGHFELPAGAIRGERVMRLLQRLTWPVQQIGDFRQLPFPFAAVATDIVTGEAVTLSSGSLAEVMRASMAVPGIFDPVQVNGRLLVDGGYVRNLPVSDARDLGADFLICSDVTDGPDPAGKLRTLIDILEQAVILWIENGVEPERELCDVLIRPDLDGMSQINFSAVESWIERGREAALSETLRLRQLVDGMPPRIRSAPTAEYLPDIVHVSDVQLRGISSERAERVALRLIDLPSSGRIDADILDEALSQLYSSHLFRQVFYQVSVSGADTTLVVDLAEETTNEIGVGLRYDDYSHAALLFTGALHNWLGFGSTLRLDLRLGEQFRVRSSYHFGPGSFFSLNPRLGVGYTHAFFDLYEDGRRTTEVGVNVTSGEGTIGIPFHRESTLEMTLGLEHSHGPLSVVPGARSGGRVQTSVTAALLRNTLNHRGFPTEGSSLRLRSRLANRGLAGGIAYTQQLLEAESALPLTASTTLITRVMIGGGTGDDLPVHRHFFLGGSHPSAVFGETRPAFWGLRPGERAGNSVQVFRLALQRRIRSGIYVTGGVDAGNVFPDWAFQPADYLVGWGASLGVSTLLGPADITVHGRNLDELPLVGFGVGFRF
jgi:NTE family protein